MEGATLVDWPRPGRGDAAARTWHGPGVWLAAGAVVVLTVGAFLAPRTAGAPPTPVVDVAVIAALGALAVRLVSVRHHLGAAALASSALVWALVGVAPLLPAAIESVVSRWALVPLAVVVAAVVMLTTHHRWVVAVLSAAVAAAAGSGAPFPALLGLGCLLLLAAGRRWRSVDALTVGAAALGLALVVLDQRVLGQAFPPPLLTTSVDVVLVGAAALLTWSLTADHRAQRVFDPTGEEADVTRWLAGAVGLPSLAVAFPDEGGGTVGLSGSPAAPGTEAFPVRDRGGRLVAYLSPPPLEDALVSRALVGVLSRLGDVARMRRREMHRAQEVTESRRRLQVESDAEGRRLERQLDATVMRRLATVGDLLAPTPHAELAARVEEVVDELRRHARGLDPLAGRSLAEALAPHADHGVTVDVGGSIADPAAARTAWYVATEALTNATKHAPGVPVAVSVRTRPGWLEVVVTDRGGGGADPSGAGLLGLVDRVRAGGGTLTITSTTSGTTVAARIPDHAGPPPVEVRAGPGLLADATASRR